MSVYFLDSSAIIKRYIAEAGTAWIESLTSPRKGNQLIVARITWVEVLSGLSRRQREGKLSLDDVEAVIKLFSSDFALQYQVVELDQTLAESAGQLVRRHPLRAFDAVQLASALAAAQAEGLLMDNPNRHP